MPYIDQKGPRIRVKVSDTPGEVMEPDGLHAGEIAINTADAKIYFKAPGGSRGVITGSLSPFWKEANDKTWPAYQAGYQAAFDSGSISASAPVTELDGLGTDIFSWMIAMDSTGERVYFWPNKYSASTDLYPNPYYYDLAANQLVEVTGMPQLPHHCFGMALLPDGKFLGVPYVNNTGFLLIDFDNKTVEEVGDYRVDGTWSVNGYAVMSNGDIMGTPLAGLAMPVYKWRTKETYVLTDELPGVGNNRCGELLPDGRVILHKNGNTGQLVVVDADSGEFQLSPDLPYSTRSGAVLPDGRYFVTPYNSDTAVPVIYDPVANTLTEIAGGAGLGTTSNKWRTLVAAEADNVMILEFTGNNTAANLVFYDYVAGAVTRTVASSEAAQQVLHCPGGRVALVKASTPSSSTSDVVFSMQDLGTSSFDSDMCRSPILNRSI